MDDWLKEQKYLPAFLHDFHAQKQLFKRLDDIAARHPSKDVLPGWISAHIYVIDVFLWYMARRGWTLQRSRQRLPFKSIEADLQAWQEEYDRQMMARWKAETTNQTAAAPPSSDANRE